MRTFQSFQILLQCVLELAIICPRDLEVKCALTLIEHFSKNVTDFRAELEISPDELVLQPAQDVQLLLQYVLEPAGVCPRDLVGQFSIMPRKDLCQHL